jgi:hypothetical protein
MTIKAVKVFELALFRKASILTAISAMLITGCGSPQTRSKDPDRYVLVDSGMVNKESTLKMQECLVDAFNELNSKNTAFSVVQTRRNAGSRIEVYVSRVNLAVSADVFDDGKTELRMAPDPFGMFSKEPGAYRSCLAIHQHAAK